MFERTRTGLKDMPSNAVWLLSRALKPAETLGDAAASARDQGRRMTAAVVDVVHAFGDQLSKAFVVIEPGRARLSKPRAEE